MKVNGCRHTITLSEDTLKAALLEQLATRLQPEGVCITGLEFGADPIRLTIEFTIDAPALRDTSNTSDVEIQP